MMNKTALHYNPRRVAIATLILTALLGAAIYPLFASKKKAAVLRLTGQARIWNSGAKKWTPLRVNTIVPDHSWIETSKRTKLVLFYQGIEVRLGSKTRVKIRNLTNRNKPGRVYVKKGFAWFKVKNRRRFNVSTPTAIASVRGTMFAVTHNKTGTATCVCEGRVATVGQQELQRGSGYSPVDKGYSHTYDPGGARYKKDFRKYFKGLKADRSFQSQILKDPKLAGCKSCHRMTNIATDNSSDPDEY